jgi:hypothetical protein
MSAWTDERNGHVRRLRMMLDGQTQEIHSANASLRWAIRHLDGLPEDWVAVVDGVPLSDSAERKP